LQPRTLRSRFVSSPKALRGQRRLFCFPYAGGSAPVFAGWSERLQPEIEVWAALPRGRGQRFRETTLETVEAMVDDYLWALRDNLDVPFAFYGHSLGGLVAFEMARRLEAEGLPTPEHLFAGASAPPHFGLVHSRIGYLPDAEFVDVVQERYAGIPAAVLNEPELMELLLPVLRADFAAYENYELADTGSLNCPITVFAGSEDRGIAPEVMAGWGQHTRGNFAMHTVPGDHFFLAVSKELVLTTVQQELQRLGLQIPAAPNLMLTTGFESA
jgi:medium-chain acyl-[acyl-carrier-protein] hydrolase